MNICGIDLSKNVSKIHSKTHQISLFKKNSRGNMPQNPIANVIFKRFFCIFKVVLKIISTWP